MAIKMENYRRGKMIKKELIERIKKDERKIKAEKAAKQKKFFDFINQELS